MLALNRRDASSPARRSSARGTGPASYILFGNPGGVRRQSHVILETELPSVGLSVSPCVQQLIVTEAGRNIGQMVSSAVAVLAERDQASCAQTIHLI